MVNYGLRCLSVIKNRKSGITLFSRPNKYFGPILVAVCFVITLIIYTPVNEFILLPQLSMHRFPIVIAKNFIYLTYSSLLGTYIHCSVCACSFAVNYGIAFFDMNSENEIIVLDSASISSTDPFTRMVMLQKEMVWFARDIVISCS